jgi:hypothetical protein
MHLSQSKADQLAKIPVAKKKESPSAYCIQILQELDEIIEESWQMARLRSA